LVYIKSSTPWQFYCKAAVYTLALVLVQALYVSRLPYPALRADLLLPLMVAIALDWSLFPSFLWAFLWGFALDTFSGKFWGLHVGTYIVAVCLVNIASDRLELHTPVYQIAFAGLCAIGQSVVLSMFLLLEPSDFVAPISAWNGIVMRSLFIMILAPLVLLPVWVTKKSR